MAARKGAEHHKARLTQEEVDQIRELYYDHHIGIAALARKWQIPEATISNVVHHRTWND